MISNKMIVEGMKAAITVAFSTWLNENKEAIRGMVCAAMTAKADADEYPKQSKPGPKIYFTPSVHLAAAAFGHVASGKDRASCARASRRCGRI